RFTDVIAYETVINQEKQQKLLDLLKTQQLDAIPFTSSSTVDHFVQLTKDIDKYQDFQSICLGAIGPITANTMQGYGLTPDIVASENTTDGLIAEMISYYDMSKKYEGGNGS